MNDNRISRDHLHMQIAQLYARRGTCGRLQVGAVIVNDGRIISTGYNGSPKGEEHCGDLCDLAKSCERAVHAEANAIYFAARMGIALEGCTIYCTHSPCVTCAKAIVQSGIKEVIYSQVFRDREGLYLLERNGIETHEYKIQNS